MVDIIDKRVRAQQFRERLGRAMTEAGTNQSALARDTGVDRSTISQLLTGDGARLPNAHVVGACASVLGVSADWLLSLSDRPETAAALMSAGLSLTEAPRALIDQQIFDWHREAQGYKIRHVPAALPDMLKTEALLEWEYAPQLGRTAEQAINASLERLEWMQASRSDYEIAMPLYELNSFAAGTGYYEGLPADLRREQLDRFEMLLDELYPRLRLSLFDARRLYSAPITVFGPLLCALYSGGHYLAFRDRERVEILSHHFDVLVREASISDRDFTAYIDKLRARI